MYVIAIRNEYVKLNEQISKNVFQKRLCSELIFVFRYNNFRKKERNRGEIRVVRKNDYNFTKTVEGNNSFGVLKGLMKEAL